MDIKRIALGIIFCFSIIFLFVFVYNAFTYNPEFQGGSAVAGLGEAAIIFGNKLMIVIFTFLSLISGFLILFSEVRNPNLQLRMADIFVFISFLISTFILFLTILTSYTSWNIPEVLAFSTIISMLLSPAAFIVFLVTGFIYAVKIFRLIRNKLS